MTFLHLQLALAGLACVSIPIIIHLLMRRRRRPVMWGAMRFLLEAYKKNRRRLMIEKWLLLAMRCLLVALLALAIGRPLLGAMLGGGSGRTVYLVVDNSLTSGAIGPDGRSALERHRAAARAILGSLQGAGVEGDRAALVALGGPAEGVVLPVSADVPAVASLVESLERADSRSDLPGALSLIAASIEADRAGDRARRARAGQVFVVVLSDLLEGSADVSANLAKLPEGVRVLASTPAALPVANIAIVGVEPLRSVVVTGKSTANGAPEATASIGEQVRVMLQRSGPGVAQTGTSTVVLSMAAVRGRGERAPLAEAGRATVRWAAGQETATAAVQASARAAQPDGAGSRLLTEIIEARLDAPSASENAIPGDDLWRRPVEVRDALRVGIVTPRQFGPRERVDRLEPSEWLRLSLRPGEESGVEVTDLEPALLDGARLAGLDAVFVPRPDLLGPEHWPRLRLFLENGGLLVVFPPSAVQVHLWPDSMVKELSLPWRVAREAKAFTDAPAAISPARSANPAAPGSAGGVGGLGGPPGMGILSLIQGELDDLSKAVSILRVLPVEGEAGPIRSVLSLGDGTPLLVVEPYSGSQAPANTDAATGRVIASQSTDRGLIVYVATALDLEWTDLPAKPLMVPLIQETLREGVGRAHGSWWSVAGGRPATPSRSAELRPIELSSRDERAPGPERARPVVAIDDTGATASPLRRAGLWQAIDDRGAVRGVVAVNPDTRASRTQVQEPAALEQWLARASPDGTIAWISGGAEPAGPDAADNAAAPPTFASLLAKDSPGSPISLPLLIAALVVALFELWLARRASHAEVSVQTPDRAGAPA